ncbi:DUF4760 domain-containing protein [Pseudoalteromonas tetraodonis]|uniref:DUF4760 domain-containing protein n=1 Tax=Pseudoalteromonas tetraodonis TaxID=43659 RepID=UPI003A96BAFE
MHNLNKTLNSNGSNLHWVFRVIWLVTFLTTLFSELGLLQQGFYKGNLALFYIVLLSSYFIGLLIPVYNATKHKVKMSIPLLVYSLFILQITYCLVRYTYALESFNYKKLDVDLYIVNFFMVSAIVIGWFVHSHNNLNSERKQHTVNVLNSSRMSSVYQENLRLATDKFNNPHKLIKEADVDIFYKWKSGELKVDFESDSDKKNAETIRSIQGVIYLLNFYEFVAAGIDSGDLDEEYLYSTVAGIAINLVAYSKKLIDKYQTEDKLTWQYIVRLSSKWLELLEQERKQ